NLSSGRRLRAMRSGGPGRTRPPRTETSNPRTVEPSNRVESTISPVSSRVWRRGAVVALCIVAAAAVYGLKVAPKMADFEVYWRAGVRAAAGESLYRAGDGHYQFKYLPAFAVIVSPLTLVGASVARAVWFAVSLTSLAGLIVMSRRLWPEWRHPGWVLVVMTVVVVGKFYAHELVLGQTNAMFGAVMTGALL